MKINLPDPRQISLLAPEHCNALVYGKQGTGKTEFGASWAGDGQVLLVDSDDGWLTIKASPRLRPVVNQIYQVPISDVIEGRKEPMGFLSVKGIVQEVSNAGRFGMCTPKTVIVDSLTTISEFAMKHVLHINRHTGQQPTLPDWGRQMRELRDLVKAGVAGPFNFICIAHEQYQKDELSGRVWCLPLVTGKLASELGLYFDEVYHAEVKAVGGKHKYELHTKASGMITAKSRLDLPGVIDSHYSEVKKKLDSLKGGP